MQKVSLMWIMKRLWIKDSTSKDAGIKEAHFVRWVPLEEKPFNYGSLEMRQPEDSSFLKKTNGELNQRQRSIADDTTN